MLQIIITFLIFILLMALVFQNKAPLWQKAFSNDDGSPSSNRIFLALILFFLFSWADSIVQAKQLIPDIPDTWLVLVGIFSGAALGTKGINAFRDVKGQPASP